MIGFLLAASVAIGRIDVCAGGNHVDTGVGIVQRSASNGAMTSGSANLDSATLAWVAATDIGRLVCVDDAAAGGRPLCATILSRTSATRVVLSANAAATVSSKLVQVLSYREVTDAAITSGTAILTSATAAFVGGDEPGSDRGRRIAVGGAGAAGAVLVATVLTVDSPTQVTLGTNASTTVTGQTLRIPKTYLVHDQAVNFTDPITDADIVGMLSVWSKLAQTDSKTIAQMEGQTVLAAVP